MKVEFDDSDKTLINAFFSEALCPDVEKGEINYPQYYYIRNMGCDFGTVNYGTGNISLSTTDGKPEYFKVLELTYTGTNASWTTTAPSEVGTSTRYRGQYLYQFRLVPTTYGYMLVNRYSGLAIAANGTAANGTCSMQTRDASDEKQTFIFEPYSDDVYKIKNYATQQYVSTWLKTTKNGGLTQLNGSNILWMTSYGYLPGWQNSEYGYRLEYLATKLRQRWQLVPVQTEDDEWDFE